MYICTLAAAEHISAHVFPDTSDSNTLEVAKWKSFFKATCNYTAWYYILCISNTSHGFINATILTVKHLYTHTWKILGEHWISIECRAPAVPKPIMDSWFPEATVDIIRSREATCSNPVLSIRAKHLRTKA